MEMSLQQILNQLRTKLKASTSKPDFVFTDAWDYYEIPGVEATMVKGQLIIQIPVMLWGTDQEPAMLHVMDKVWVPIANETGLYTQMSNLPKFLAVSTSGEVTEVGQHELTKGLFYLHSVPISAPKNHSTAVLFVSTLSFRCFCVAPKHRANRCSAFAIYLHCFQSIVKEISAFGPIFDRFETKCKQHYFCDT